MKSLSLNWIKRLCDTSTGKWKAIPALIYKTSDLKFFFSCNQKPFTNSIQPEFYKFIQCIWSEINEISQPSAQIIYNQFIWNNRYITIENRSFLWKRWKDAGINRISDLYLNNCFITTEELAIRYGLTVNFLELIQIRQSITFTWRSIIKNN